jgi:hippurate hydrolase
MPQVHLPKNEFVPATYTHRELTKRLVGVWKNSSGGKKCRDGRPDDGGEGFAEFSLPDHSIPAVGFHVGAVAPEKIAASRKPGAPPLPSLHSSKFVPGARADDSQWSGRIDERGTRLD